MTGQFEMFALMTCATSISAISSPGLEDGRLPCASPDTNACRAGLDRHHANRSPSPGADLPRPTNDISRPSGLISSASAALQQSLESKLRTRLGEDGSTIYSMRWKDAATPAGRLYCQLVASVRRISANGSSSERSGWPTPHANSTTGAGSEGRSGGLNIQTAAQLAGWPTCTATDAIRGEKYDPFAPNMTLNMAVQRTGWHTPLARDGDKLDATPAAMEARMTPVVGWAEHMGPIRITADGQVLTGSDAGTASSGQLNPAHSRWLMGYPPAWDDCAVTAMPSSRKRQRSSSKSSAARSPKSKSEQESPHV